MSYIPTQPDIMPIPFCTNGDAADIPPTENAEGRASLDKGFPAITRVPIGAGGIAPNGLDFNGILKWLSEFCTYNQSGGLFTWDAALNYSKPSMVVGSNGTLYFCEKASGPDVVGVGAKDPVTETEGYWSILPTVTDIFIGKVALLPYRVSDIPNGWYFMNGDTYALTSAQGQALNGLSANIKTDFGIEVTGAVGSEVINVPNFFASDGTGATFTPANGTDLAVGQIQEDMGRNATGYFVSYNVGIFIDAQGVFVKSQPSPYTYLWQSLAGTFQTIAFDLHEGYPAANRGQRFKVYGRGMTPAMFLGV